MIFGGEAAIVDVPADFPPVLWEVGLVTLTSPSYLQSPDLVVAGEVVRSYFGKAAWKSFWTVSEGRLGSLIPHTRRVLCSIWVPCLFPAYWMLIGACDPML